MNVCVVITVAMVMLLGILGLISSIYRLVGWLAGWLVGDHLLLRDLGIYGIIFMTM
jgi:hypothetical protein